MNYGSRPGQTASMKTAKFGGLLFVLALALASPVARAQQGSAANPDSNCLACHSQPDLKSDSGRSLFVDPAKHKASVHADLPCMACHTDIKEFPHPAKIKKVECATCHADEASAIPASVHGLLGDQACVSCHDQAHYARPAATVMPQKCGECHSDEVKAFLKSVHGMAGRNGNSDSPTCESCHGSIHQLLAVDDPQSPIAKKNLPQTCGACHANPDFVARHKIPFAHPVEAYSMSVHGRAVAAGNDKAASCSDCHGSHDILDARDPASKINHWNVPATCGTCHADIKLIYDQSIHGQAVANGSRAAPVCTDCHGEHNILAPSEAGSTVSPALVSTVTCGRCHGDAQLVARYNLPADRVPTFADSYHGLAARAGGQTVANCASCHGIHNIYPSSDPRSTVNPANLSHTCGQCHAGAGKDFAIGPVHVWPGSVNEHPVVRFIRLTYWFLIPLAVGFMFLHHLLDFQRKLRRKGPRVESGEEVERMNLNFRIAHWLTMVSFPVLVVTGFALKYPESWWARPMLVWETHFALRGLVHRIAAVVLLSSLAYHILHLVLVKRDRAFPRYMVPRLRDLQDLGDMLLYNLGFAKTRPKFGKFNYVEKIEYFAFLWGTAVMAASGLLLWFNSFVLRHFPKWVLDAATSLHFYEAILATLAILIWHLYSVIFDPDVYPMDRAWLTGKTSADHLRHTRPEYYATLQERAEEAARDAKAKQETASTSENVPSVDPPKKEKK